MIQGNACFHVTFKICSETVTASPSLSEVLELKRFLQRKLSDSDTLAKTAYHLYQLRKNQWKKIEELKKIQLRRLKAIVTYAYYHVPYYRKILRSARIKPEQVKNIDDLRKIPITTKSDVQVNRPNIISNGVDVKKCTTNTTSGSTGTPLQVIADSKARHYSIALLQYAFFECGLRLRDKLASVEVRIKTGKSMLRPPIGVGFLGMTRLSWMNTIEENIRLLKKIRPDALYIYPSVLLQLAREIRKENPAEINPRLIFSHGETLTPRCIQLATSTFDTRIHDLYGCAEFNRLAFQCDRHSGLHMITDGAVIEIIKDGENVDYGEPGEIVVTGLYNYAMPLIRYRIGDIGVTTDESCDCGRSWPLIKRIEGRSSDFLVLPSGQALSPMNLLNAMDPKYVKGVMEYQIIQESKGSFLVKVVVNQEFNSAQVLSIQKRMQLRCYGEEVRVDVQAVNEIEKDKTGKARIIVSKIARPRL